MGLDDLIQLVLQGNKFLRCLSDLLTEIEQKLKKKKIVSGGENKNPLGTFPASLYTEGYYSLYSTEHTELRERERKGKK